MKVLIKMDVLSHWILQQSRRLAEAIHANPFLGPILVEVRDILMGQKKAISASVGIALVVVLLLTLLISGVVAERLIRYVFSDSNGNAAIRRGKASRRAALTKAVDASPSDEEQLPLPGPHETLPPGGIPGRVFACRLCVQDLHAAALSGLSADTPSDRSGLTVSNVMARHVDGKRHVKAAADAGAPKRSGVAWITTDEWQALQRKRAKLLEANKPAREQAAASASGDDSDSDGEAAGKVAAAAAASAAQRGRQGGKASKRGGSPSSDSDGPDADGFITVGGRGKGKGKGGARRRRGHGSPGARSGSDSDDGSRDRAPAVAAALAASRGLPAAAGGAGAAASSGAAVPAAAAAAPVSRSAADAAWMVSTSRKKAGKKGEGGAAGGDGGAGVVGATFVAGRGGGGGAGGAGSASAVPAVKAPRVMRSLVHYEGGLNILEGLEMWPKFVSPAQEAGLIAAVDAALADGQRGRLRAATYRPTRTGGDAALLQFGAAVDAAGALASGGALRAVEPSRLVDVIPAALLEMPRRIATLGREELTLPRGLRAEDLCVATAYVLEPGMHLPPMRPVADAGAFHQPVLLLALTAPGRDGPSTEQVLFGQHIAPAGDLPGAFDASFALTIKGKTLLCLREPVATDVQIAVPATTGRLILIVFRWPKDELKDQLSSRGNIRL